MRSHEGAEVLIEDVVKAVEAAFTAANFATEEYLESRDENPFDADWSKAYREVEKAKGQLSEMQRAGIAEASRMYRERAFKAVFHVSKNSELAGCLSDDVGLILESDRVAFDSPWVAQLREAYRCHELPTGRLVFG